MAKDVDKKPALFVCVCVDLRVLVLPPLKGLFTGPYPSLLGIALCGWNGYSLEKSPPICYYSTSGYKCQSICFVLSYLT